MRKKRNKNLDLYYPTCVLESERDNIHGLPKDRVEQLNEAIRILNDERYKIEKKVFKKQEKERKEKERERKEKLDIIDF